MHIKRGPRWGFAMNVHTRYGVRVYHVKGRSRRRYDTKAKDAEGATHLMDWPA